MNKFTFVLLCCSNVFGFSTDHLPLAEQLSKTFPKLFSEKFLIVHPKSELVVHGNVFDITSVENEFEVRNANNENFKIALGGFHSIDELKADLKAIKSWLDQFFSYRVLSADEVISEVPVFYGQKSKYRISSNGDHYIILSKNQNRRIKRTFIYRTMLSAPVPKNLKIGTAIYKVDTFQNSIKKDIVTLNSIQKTGRYRTILDSLSYVIFGAPFEQVKIHRSEEF